MDRVDYSLLGTLQAVMNITVLISILQGSN